MNIKSDFLVSLVSPPKISVHCKPEDFLGKIYNIQPDPSSPLFQLLSGGSIKAFFPYSFDIRSMDCFMLLYTKEGCGKLSVNNQVYTLAASSLLFLDCHGRFRLDVAIEPWEYQVYFLTGGNLSYYYEMLPGKRPALMPLSPYSDIMLCLEKLSVHKEAERLISSLSVSNLINTVITGCLTYQLTDHSLTPVIPAYLKEMQNLFDNAFFADYSLDALEERFAISKYRLCREFSAAFGLPPLQYLNRRRIEIAGHLLLTTSLKVHEAGSKVGIDNTNHFISLFKKYTGFTPLEYKQRMTL